AGGEFSATVAAGDAGEVKVPGDGHSLTAEDAASDSEGGGTH
ncbi:hypothetical protein N325_06404, partial [Colius striatus]